MAVERPSGRGALGFGRGEKIRLGLKTGIMNHPQAPHMDDLAYAITQEESIPGISRRAYLLFTLALIAIALPSHIYWQYWQEHSLEALDYATRAEVNDLAVYRMRDALASLAYYSSIPVAFVQLYLIALRIRNIGFSRWWIILSLVPIANCVLGTACFACPSGYARTRKLDTPGKITASVVFILLTLVLVTITWLVVEKYFRSSAASEFEGITFAQWKESCRSIASQTRIDDCICGFKGRFESAIHKSAFDAACHR